MRRSRTGFALLIALAGAACAGLIALGVWQVHRLAWKEALIARVDARVHAAPAPAPGPRGWPAISADNDEYRRVTATGRYLAGHDTRVKAVTEAGAGFWLMTPFESARGFTILVNRGLVRDDAAPSPPAGVRRVTGLLRITEPGGGFLRANDPAADRWFSRDVAAIARARRIERVAPYFIDAARGSEPGGPIGGLTVIRFANNHLSYAITWFALAAMVGAAAALLIRERVRSHKA